MKILILLSILCSFSLSAKITQASYWSNGWKHTPQETFTNEGFSFNKDSIPKNFFTINDTEPRNRSVVLRFQFDSAESVVLEIDRPNTLVDLILRSDDWKKSMEVKDFGAESLTLIPFKKVTASGEEYFFLQLVITNLQDDYSINIEDAER
jgi:hypothetical protein